MNADHRSECKKHMRLAGASIAAIFGVALCFVPASAAMVGQTVSVSDATMACPSVAALSRFKKASADNPALASKDALTAGCRELDPSKQGVIAKVAGANLCAIFSAEGGGCLWLPAAAASGRIDPAQDPGASQRSRAPLSGVVEGLQKLFGGF